MSIKAVSQRGNLDWANSKAVIIENQGETSSCRYALSLAEFQEQFPALHEEKAIWYKEITVGGEEWKKFFSDMNWSPSDKIYDKRYTSFISFHKMLSLRAPVLDTALSENQIQILSSDYGCDPDYGDAIVQYQIADAVLSYSFVEGKEYNDHSIQECFINGFLREQHDYPLWTDIPEKLLAEIVKVPFDMHFIEYDDEDYTEELANELLLEAENHGLSNVVTQEDDCYLTIFAGAMCNVNWIGHEKYGNYYRGEKKMRCQRCKRECQSFRMSWLNTQMICDHCQLEETEHPLYEKAKERELEEVKKGNYNYPGLLEK